MSKTEANLFKTAVEATLDIKDCYRTGLKALGNHSNKVLLEYTSRCEGSVDIDTCVKAKYPNARRWDYCFSYQNEVFFVEVHPANTSNVSNMLEKLKWLENWLVNNAPKVNAMRAKSKTPFYWVKSGAYDILPNSPQYKKAAQAGILPIARLELKPRR